MYFLADEIFVPNFSFVLVDCNFLDNGCSPSSGVELYAAGVLVEHNVLDDGLIRQGDHVPRCQSTRAVVEFHSLIFKIVDPVFCLLGDTADTTLRVSLWPPEKKTLFRFYCIQRHSGFYSEYKCLEAPT